MLTATSSPALRAHPGTVPHKLVPAARGRLTEALLAALVHPPRTVRLPHPKGADPLGDDDEALALYLCYELSYRGLAAVDEGWEWEPSLLGFRRELEARFVEVLRGSLPTQAISPADVASGVCGALAADRSPSVSSHLERAGSAEQFREFAIH
ncbi:MAG: iron-containing redox enzyme family protein, partial [Acidimicrobiales bacterium]